jgi:hypothetical protein
MSDTALLALCAAHSFAFAAFHLAFRKLFGWREALPRMSVANRAILLIANLRLVYVFLRIDRPLVHLLSALFVLGIPLFAWPALR